MFLVSSCSCLCPIPRSQALSREWGYSWSSADRRCSNYIWVINSFIAYWGATYIRGLTVLQIALDLSNRTIALVPVNQLDRICVNGSHESTRIDYICWVIISFIAYKGAIFIRVLTVLVKSLQSISHLKAWHPEIFKSSVTRHHMYCSNFNGHNLNLKPLRWRHWHSNPNRVRRVTLQ